MKSTTQFTRLHSAIHSKLETLTATERRIASYVLEQTHEIALVSVQELAARLNTGPASIMRASVLASLDAGPSVATTLVLRIMR